VFLFRLPFLTEDGLFDLIRKSKPSGSKAAAKQDEKGKSSEKTEKVQTKSSPLKVMKKGICSLKQSERERDYCTEEQ
jgi:replication factor C subunit 1